MRKISIIFLFLLLIICCSQQKSNWKGSIKVVDGVTIVKNPKEGLWDSKEDFKILFKEVRQIGADENASEEYSFRYISDIAVNSKGDIYVADRQLSNIKKFNETGEYLLTLGRKGQGPGEFQMLNNVFIGRNDALIAYDSFANRFSFFSDKGDFIKTQKLQSDSWFSLSKLLILPEKQLFFGHMGNSTKLIHEFDHDWKLMDSYIDYEFIDNKEFENFSLSFANGNCFFLNNQEFLYTKKFYDNQIFIYKNKKIKTRILKDSDIKKPYAVKVFNDVNKAMELPRDPEYDSRSFGQKKAYFTKIFHQSLGVFKLSDGKIANFVKIRRSKEMHEFGVELFDSEGKFLHYSKFNDKAPLSLLHKDKNDQFYSIAYKDGHYVQVFRLEY